VITDTTEPLRLVGRERLTAVTLAKAFSTRSVAVRRAPARWRRAWTMEMMSARGFFVSTACARWVSSGIGEDWYGACRVAPGGAEALQSGSVEEDATASTCLSADEPLESDE